MSRTRRLWIYAALAALAAVVHDGGHVLRGTAHDVLWMCNVAPVLLAVGSGIRDATLVSVATLWLGYGTPLWLLDLAGGSTLIPTSVLPHLLCPVLGVLAVRELGVPKHAWLRASAALVVVLVLARVFTPPEANVNLVYSVWKGWGAYFPRHDLYLAFIGATSIVSFFLMERLLRLVAEPGEVMVS
jgi:hypothetical protein